MAHIQNTVTGEITVEYCSTHNSHSIQLAHLPIPKDIKHQISAKLHEGVSVNKILDDIRGIVNAGNIKSNCEARHTKYSEKIKFRLCNKTLQ